MESVAECGLKVNIQRKDRDGYFDFDFFFTYNSFFFCDDRNVEAMISISNFFFFFSCNSLPSVSFTLL